MFGLTWTCRLLLIWIGLSGPLFSCLVSLQHAFSGKISQHHCVGPTCRQHSQLRFIPYFELSVLRLNSYAELTPISISPKEPSPPATHNFLIFSSLIMAVPPPAVTKPMVLSLPDWLPIPHQHVYENVQCAWMYHAIGLGEIQRTPWGCIHMATGIHSHSTSSWW